jgi:hypothetical protein
LCRIEGIWVQHGLHVSELHKLTALTRLCVTYEDSQLSLIDDSLRGLAELTQLHFLRLEINTGDDLAPGVFLPLTSLTGLTALEYQALELEGVDTHEFQIVSKVRLTLQK